jgi:predicted N-acyltransferase
MDMMSNPGFVTEPEQSEKIVAAMAQYLKEHSLLTLIYDYSDRVDLYPGSSALWSAPHALIDTTSFSSIQDYIGEHKNIKKKMNIFYNNGGTFEIVRNVLTEESIAALRRCFVATSEKSSTYLPYQDLYLNAALTTSRMLLEQVYYFVARLNGEFLGYQAALQTGSRLNALHGAFDRERKTTYHAYDLLFVKMTEFALANKLDSIDFGAVINITKQRSVNRIVPMSYFLYSKYHLVQRFFVMLLRRTKVQGKEQMQFNIKKESS